MGWRWSPGVSPLNHLDVRPSFLPVPSDPQKIRAAVRENEAFNLQVPPGAFKRRFCKRKKREKCEGRL